MPDFRQLGPTFSPSRAWVFTHNVKESPPPLRERRGSRRSRRCDAVMTRSHHLPFVSTVPLASSSAAASHSGILAHAIPPSLQHRAKVRRLLRVLLLGFLRLPMEAVHTSGCHALRISSRYDAIFNQRLTNVTISPRDCQSLSSNRRSLTMWAMSFLTAGSLTCETSLMNALLELGNVPRSGTSS